MAATNYPAHSLRQHVLDESSSASMSHKNTLSSLFSTLNVPDRGCKIPEGLVIGEDPELDARRFYRSDGGVTLVSADMLAALG